MPCVQDETVCESEQTCPNHHNLVRDVEQNEVVPLTFVDVSGVDRAPVEAVGLGVMVDLRYGFARLRTVVACRQL